MPMLVRAWILLSAWLVGAGWILSVLHALNRRGYLVVFVFGILLAVGFGLVVWRRRPGSPILVLKYFKRFKRPAPLFFLALALLSFFAGALYPATGADAHAYRIPRVLHWLAGGGWHWIPTGDPRFNVVGCGFEWLSTPLILFSGTDRLLFLINWLSYLMLPGLTFGVLTQLGVSRRVAWWWMWILASGWCYIFQAGSDLNDSFAVVYALAAIDLALRCQKSGRLTDGWLSLLAAALTMGSKQTNMPLVILWLIAFWPARRLFFSRPMSAVVVAVWGLLVSALPIILLNFAHAGTWTGIDRSHEAKSLVTAVELNSPFWGVLGNSFCLPVQNLLPPVFPWVNQWNAAMRHFLTTPFGTHFAMFEKFGFLGAGAHGVNAVNAGLGLGIWMLILVSLVFVATGKSPAASVRNQPPRIIPRWLRLAPWGLLIIFMAKDGAFTNARHLAPYYIFFFPSLLIARGHSWLVRRRWWQWSGLTVMLISIALLLLSRQQPLYPAITLFHQLEKAFPQAKVFSRARVAYESRLTVVQQTDWLAAHMPSGENVLGYVSGFGGRDAYLWRPFGQRRVERVLPGDSRASLLAKNIRYVFIDDVGPGKTPEAWMQQYQAVLADRLLIEANANEDASYIYLVRLDNSTGN